MIAFVPGRHARHPFSAVVAAVAIATVGSLWGAQWRLDLRTGEVVAGEVHGLDGTVRLYDQTLRAERTLEATAVARLLHTGPAPVRPVGPVLTLHNGDRLVGTAVVLDDAGLRLTLPGGGSLCLARAQVSALEPRQSGAPEEANDLEDLADWRGRTQGWARTASGLQACSLPAVLGCQEVLSERVRVVVDVPANPAPDLWLYLFTDATSEPAGSSYALNLQGDRVTCERQYARGPARPIGNCRLAASDGALYSLTLSVDLTRGRFRLDPAGGPGTDWTDGGVDRPDGRGLKLVSLKAPAEVRALRVTRLAATSLAVGASSSPSADRVFLANGDRLEGEIVAVNDVSWTVRRGIPTKSLQIPTAAVHLAYFRAAPGSPAEPARDTEVRLYSGSCFRATCVRIQDQRLQVQSAAWGKADFPLIDVQELRFPLP